MINPSKSMVGGKEKNSSKTMQRWNSQTWHLQMEEVDLIITQQ